jgi:hypothetical protein
VAPPPGSAADTRAIGADRIPLKKNPDPPTRDRAAAAEVTVLIGALMWWYSRRAKLPST